MKRLNQQDNSVNPSLEIVEESIYDHPKYYDLVFGADCAAEIQFILGCGERYLDQKPKRFFEPACGTGRLIHALAKRDFHVAGLDLNEKAIEFCNARLSRRGLKPTTFVADMSKFEVKKSFDIGFNTINSFRHLGTEQAAREHLKCMGQAIIPGGLYLLGVHLTPSEVPPSETESWSARRGHLAINTHMWTKERDPKNRVERFGIQFDVHQPTRSFRILDELVLRSYTSAQMNRLIRSSGCWDTIETYSFAYDLDDPIEVDGSCEDVVYVLRNTTTQ
ncbi:class I SAM-dependent methyltransferase [Rhodopirellula sp.]|nr:class I SAM-dependent methyltransferase [Rhodopirellula sp.]MDB4679007.1 class I SAM-dependent methyltransferase [Rhodopirellula sp.]